MKTYLVLDTNIIYNDFYFSDPQVKAVSRMRTAFDLYLCIPKTILMEVLTKYRYQLNTEINKLSNISSRLKKQFNINLPSLEVDIDKNIEEYESFLKSKFSGFNLIIEFPKISHEYLVAKAVQRKKPFKENGSGYRDALIWENILELLKDGNEVFFVTNNTSDFMEDKKLHNDLEAELHKNGIPRNHFAVFPDVKTIFDIKIKPKLEIIDIVREEFVKNSLEGVDLDKLNNRVEKELDSIDIGAMLPDSYDHGSYQILSHTISVGKIDDVWLLDNTDCYINYYYDCSYCVEYYIEKNKLKVKDVYEIIDANWNDTVGLVSISLDVKIGASLIYDIERKEEIQFEFQIIE